MLRCELSTLWQRSRKLLASSPFRSYSAVSSSGVSTAAQCVGSRPFQVERVPAGTGIRRVAPVRCLHVDLVEEVPMLTGKEQLVARMRSLITSNSPLSLSDTEREELSAAVQDLFNEGSVKRVLYSTMVCCPFHAAANAHLPDEERYAYNKLFILYVSNDQDFFYQFGNKYEQLPREYVLDDWLMLRDFTSFVEAYSDGVMSVAVNFAAPPECVIYCHDDFLKVRQSIKDPRAYFHSAFAHSCSAAVMNLGYHKGWSKGMLLPQENSMVVACEIQTLKNYVDRIVTRRPPPLNWCDFTKEAHPDELDIVEKLKTEFGRQQLTFMYSDWFYWVKLTISESDKFLYQPLYYLIRTFSMMSLNYYSMDLQMFPRTIASDTDLKVIDDLMQRFRKALPLYQDSGRDGNISKTPFKHLDPRDMLLFSVSGSKLYNLHLPTSDEDFVCAYQYKNPRSVIRATILQSANVIDFRDTAKRVGDDDLSVIVGYEVRKMILSFLKGSVEFYQILFYEDKLLFEHPLMKELRKNADRIMSEHVVDNFRKYCKHFLRELDKEQPKMSAGKCLYQVFHKLNQVEKMIRGERPIVLCTGEHRDFIMKIRRGEMEHQYPELQEEAWNRLYATSAYRQEHGPAWPAECDKEYLTEWLHEVYGFRPSAEKWTGSVFDVELDGVKTFVNPNNLELLQREHQDWDVSTTGICN